MERKELIKLTEELIAVPYCCPELKETARAWLSALDTEGERAAAEALINELEEDVIKVDDAIAFFSSPAAAEHFGEEGAARMSAHMRELKENGAVYCDCEACSKGAELIENRESLLK